ncbi:MAG: PHP domain-containing protein, partial [Saprospiraceae bacterium]|nr:PHP domain-containing protein [Saprospiraceae bacterium]
MNNKEIARAFNLLAKLMELHSENPYKIRSYQNAYNLLSKLGTPLSEMSEDQIKELKGVGTAISGKIHELLQSGKMSTLERYKDVTPQGIQDLVMIKGLGAKKVMTAWKELGVETAGELLYACQENRLVELKGFGRKTQEEVRKQLHFFLENQSRILYPKAAKAADELVHILKKAIPKGRIEWTGDLRRRESIIDTIDLLVTTDGKVAKVLDEHPEWSLRRLGENDWQGVYPPNFSFRIREVGTEAFGFNWFVTTGPDELSAKVTGTDHLKTESDCFTYLGIKDVAPEARNLLATHAPSKNDLVDISDIKGLIHVHSTYSDGVDSLADLAAYAIKSGFEYLGITDHSQIAVYANGISEDRLSDQWNEIDEINKGITGCKVLKGIECDILSDGKLDYDDAVRSQFDFVIASVHTNIKMDEQKATSRILKAIEHPHTNILGHPTGRLLLARDGYPL